MGSAFFLRLLVFSDISRNRPKNPPKHPKHRRTTPPTAPQPRQNAQPPPGRAGPRSGVAGPREDSRSPARSGQRRPPARRNPSRLGTRPASRPGSSGFFCFHHTCPGLSPKSEPPMPRMERALFTPKDSKELASASRRFGCPILDSRFKNKSGLLNLRSQSALTRFKASAFRHIPVWACKLPAHIAILLDLWAEIQLMVQHMDIGEWSFFYQ